MNDTRTKTKQTLNLLQIKGSSHPRPSLQFSFLLRLFFVVVEDKCVYNVTLHASVRPPLFLPLPLLQLFSMTYLIVHKKIKNRLTFIHWGTGCSSSFPRKFSVQVLLCGSRCYKLTVALCQPGTKLKIIFTSWCRLRAGSLPGHSTNNLI